MGTGAATPTWQELSLLAVRALEAGDQATALALPPNDPSDPTEEGAYRSALIRMIAGGQALQADGDVAAAERRYHQATQLLPDRLMRTDRNGRGFALRVTPQRIDDDPDPLLCRLANVIERDQVHLEGLKKRLRRCLSARDFVIEAATEWQGEIECNPFAWISVETLSVTPARNELLRRATRLRQWIAAREGDVSETVWKDIGAHRGLWAAAMTKLADRSPDPTDRTRPNLPPRQGHQEAAERARRWKKGLEY